METPSGREVVGVFRLDAALKGKYSLADYYFPSSQQKLALRSADRPWAPIPLGIGSINHSRFFRVSYDLLEGNKEKYMIEKGFKTTFPYILPYQFIPSCQKLHLQKLNCLSYYLLQNEGWYSMIYYRANLIHKCTNAFPWDRCWVWCRKGKV